MKKVKQFIDMIGSKNLLMYLFMAVCAMLGVIDASGVLLAESAAGHEGVGKFGEDIQTIESAEENTPDLIKKYLNKKLKEQNPTSTPLDTIFREVETDRGEKGAMNGSGDRSMVYEYYAVDSKPVQSAVKTLYTKVEGSETAEIEVEIPALFSKKDTIIVRGVSGYEPGETQESGRPLILWVQDKLSNGKLVIRALNGKTIGQVSSGRREVPSISAGAKLFRSGKAHHELDVQTTPFSAWPSKTENYCQIFKTQVEAGVIYQLQNKEFNWTPTINERLAMDDMKMTTEASFLFGEKAKTYAPYSNDADANGYIYTTGGIVHGIKKKIDYDKTNGINEKFFSSALKSIFTGNGGSRKRVAFMGSGFTENVNNIDSVKRQLGAKEHAVAWGMDWDEIVSPFGSLMCMRHEVLDLYGWEDLCIVLDINNVSKVTFSGLERMVLDLKKSGQRNVDAAVITEIAGTELYYPSTHAIIKPKDFDLKG